MIIGSQENNDGKGVVRKSSPQEPVSDTHKGHNLNALTIS